MFQSEFQSAIDQDQNQNLTPTSYQIDDFMEKLKLLGYERQLLKEMKLKPLSRFYFQKSVNPGEQFFMFTSICAWLIRKTGRNFEQPQEFDDPSTTISKIIKILQEQDIPTDFPSNKLIQGAGPICVFILDCLSTQALKISKNNFEKMEVQKEEETPVEILETDSEIILEKVEEEQMAIASEESDDEVNEMFNLNLANGVGVNNKNRSNLKNFKADSLSDSENWRLELERVLPQLKVVVKSDSRDWRSHLEQMKILRGNIETATESTTSHLEKLQNDITFVMEKIDSREKHLNNDLKNLIQQYRTVSLEVSQINNSIKENDVEKSSKEQELMSIINELETVKIQMEQRGNTMTDGSPLINIKKAIVRIKDEISQMDLQIGVMEHSLNTDIVKQSIQYAEMDHMTAVY